MPLTPLARAVPLAPPARALTDAGVVARQAAKVLQVPGYGCLWWTGAISGRGHGRFWPAEGHVVIAHRFSFGLVHGAQGVDAVPVLGHRCASGSATATSSRPRPVTTGESGRLDAA